MKEKLEILSSEVRWAQSISMVTIEDKIDKLHTFLNQLIELLIENNK